MIHKRRKIAIIGAGHVGATLGFILATKDIADVVLIDIIDGVPQGKALDIAQASSILGYSISITGNSDFSALEGADLVIVTAGFPRKPGMDRIDLLKKNAEIISSTASHIKEKAPESIVIVVTNPVDVMTYLLWKETEFPPERVMGQAGVLDGARFHHFLSEKINVSSTTISSVILGGHGDSMVPVSRLTSFSGVPMETVLTDEHLEPLIEKTQKGGAQIVSLLKTGSAYFAPAAATALMSESIVLDQQKVLVCSAYLRGEYDINDLYIGVPVRLGRNGVEQVYQMKLTEREKKQFHESAELYKKALEQIAEEN